MLKAFKIIYFAFLFGLLIAPAHLFAMDADESLLAFANTHPIVFEQISQDPSSDGNVAPVMLFMQQHPGLPDGEVYAAYQASLHPLPPPPVQPHAPFVIPAPEQGTDDDFADYPEIAEALNGVNFDEIDQTIKDAEKLSKEVSITQKEEQPLIKYSIIKKDSEKTPEEFAATLFEADPGYSLKLGIYKGDVITMTKSLLRVVSHYYIDRTFFNKTKECCIKEIFVGIDAKTKQLVALFDTNDSADDEDESRAPMTTSEKTVIVKNSMKILYANQKFFSKYLMYQIALLSMYFVLTEAADGALQTEHSIGDLISGFTSRAFNFDALQKTLDIEGLEEGLTEEIDQGLQAAPSAAPTAPPAAQPAVPATPATPAAEPEEPEIINTTVIIPVYQVAQTLPEIIKFSFNIADQFLLNEYRQSFGLVMSDRVYKVANSYWFRSAKKILVLSWVLRSLNSSYKNNFEEYLIKNAESFVDILIEIQKAQASENTENEKKAITQLKSFLTKGYEFKYGFGTFLKNKWACLWRSMLLDAGTVAVGLAANKLGF